MVQLDPGYFDAVSVLNDLATAEPQPIFPDSWLVTPQDTLSIPEPSLTFDQEKSILDNYFAYIHPCMPILHRDKFRRQHEDGSANRDLLTVMLTMTAKILGRPNYWDELDFAASLQTHLHDRSVPSIDKAAAGRRPSLDDFREACLLAFYEFHQSPGEKAWLRIGNLTRKAHHYRLHQIDHRAGPLPCMANALDEEERDEWKVLWWCIFCLDSYSNITAAIPFVIQIDSIRTSLLADSGPLDGHGGARRPEILLPDEPDLLWKVAKEVLSLGRHVNFNMHIVTTALLRESATLYRLWYQAPSERLKSRIAAFETHTAALRLALPPWYLRTTRDVLHDESCEDYHARLICVLHINAAHLLTALSLPQQGADGEQATFRAKTLAYSQDIVAVVEQWDGQRSTGVDPAVCFIIYAALVVLQFHIDLLGGKEPKLDSRLGTCRTLLLLFLEQFAEFWYLPKFLIRSFNKYCQITHDKSGGSSALLKSFQVPLHPEWVANVSGMDLDMALPSPPEGDAPAQGSQDWGSRSWPNALGYT